MSDHSDDKPNAGPTPALTPAAERRKLAETLKLAGYSEAEIGAMIDAGERTRARAQLAEIDRERWQSPLKELAAVEEDEGARAMGERLIERTQLCGWDEENDLRLQALIIGLVESLDLEVRRHRRTGEVTIKQR